MTTALEFIRRALRLANVVGDGQTPEASDAADGLTWLNDMLDSWSAESLMVYAQVPDTVTLTGGTFNGTATTATLNARDEMLVVHFDSAGRGQVVSNVGSVALP